MKLFTPLEDKDILRLKIGDKVFLSGIVYTARDKTHKKLIEALDKGESPPFSLDKAVLFYAGPTPAKEGEIIGAIGPTTSRRMDSYTPLLLSKGVKGMIGKGRREEATKKAIVKNKAVYFVTYGGAASYLSKYVEEAEVVAYPKLGTEALFKLKVKDFPLIVAIDSTGKDFFEEATGKWRK